MSATPRAICAVSSVILLSGCIVTLPPNTEYSPPPPVYAAPSAPPTPAPVQVASPPPFPVEQPAPAPAAPPSIVYVPQPVPVAPPPPRFSREQVERIVDDAYRDVLDRRPDRRGFEHYREHLLRDGWSPEQVVRDLQRSEEARALNPDLVITKAYREVLGREPDAGGLSHYREMWRDGWTQGHIRADLSQSAEARDRIIRVAVTRSFQELLGRAPDADGLAHYQNLMRNSGWSEDQVRIAIMKSPEYRAKHR